jgi:hypothetical protein
MLAALRGQSSDGISDLTHAQGSLAAAGKLSLDTCGAGRGQRPANAALASRTSSIFQRMISIDVRLANG